MIDYYNRTILDYNFSRPDTSGLAKKRSFCAPTATQMRLKINMLQHLLKNNYHIYFIKYTKLNKPRFTVHSFPINTSCPPDYYQSFQKYAALPLTVQFL